MRALMVSGAFAVVMLIVLALALAWRAQDQQRLEDARRANCEAIEQLKEIQRVALQETIASTRAFLAENPEGVPGISPEVIRAGITRNERQLSKLAAKEC